VTEAFRARGFELRPWQQDAVSAWAAGPGAGRPFFGTLEIVTGGGKTLIALACAAAAAQVAPGLRVAVVVPTEALARQWRTALERYTTLRPGEVGVLGAGERGDLHGHRALISVINTAAKRLPEMAEGAQPLMLIVDECHRAGAPSYSRVLHTPAKFRLGLSATPDREELDDFGEPLRYDEQLVGRLLGPVVFQFSLRDARLSGWLPDFELHHHGVSLLPEEQRRYDTVSRQVDDVAEDLRAVGFDPSRAQQLQTRRDEAGQVARRYMSLTASRKDLLYRAAERARVTERILTRALHRSNGTPRALLFHERVAESERLYQQLRNSLPGIPMALEHSRLPDRQREEALTAFRSGRVRVLVSVKSLVEGIDVPEADVGISVAATSSVRQRIQALGRILRRGSSADGQPKKAEMHLLYVNGTVDELIYAKEDWTDLTGEGANHYWLWPPDSDEPQRQPGPPASPRPTEEQEWLRLGQDAPAEPVRWLGVLTGQEYSVDTLGTVTNSSDAVISNPQQAAAAVERVRGRPGGRFRVTPAHRLLLVFGPGDDGHNVPYVAGQLAEPFVAAESAPAAPETAAQPTEPGQALPGRPDKDGGTYRLRQKQGGVIERRAPDGATEFAVTTGADPRAVNARQLLDAWRQTADRGITCFVTRSGVVWYLEAGKPRFLARVPGGFVWPSAQEDS
jgi:superfamily II DNA or RNA helicase